MRIRADGKKSGQNRQQEENEKYVQSIQTRKEIAAKIIGVGGATINAIKKKFGVRIDTETNGNDRVFRIEGKRDRVREARNEISRKIVDTNRDDEDRREYTDRGQENRQKYQTVCRYYMQGTCKFGNRCRYLHTDKHPVDISPRTPATDRNRENSNRRWETTESRTRDHHRNRSQERDTNRDRESRTPRRPHRTNNSQRTPGARNTTDSRSRSPHQKRSQDDGILEQMRKLIERAQNK